LICSSTDCDSGTSPAPKMPCSRRKITSSARLVALPHRAEATVKPTTEIKNTYFMPKRPASQPVSGMVIAAATMYEVSTQAIWSWAADRLPWIWGSATLAIVLSTPCMIVASMIETVIAPRWPSGLRAPPLKAAPGIATPLPAGDRRPSGYDTQNWSRRLRDSRARQVLGDSMG
jgi:hypothetical protein